MGKKSEMALGLVLLGLLVIFTIKSVLFLSHEYGSLDKSVQTGIATALAVVSVAIIGYFTNKSIETKKSVEQALRPRKLELYQEFITFFLRVLGKEGVVQKPTEKEMIKFYTDSTPLLVSFASSTVIKKWGKLRLSMAEGEGTTNLFNLEELLQEIRKDLGHSGRGFKKGDVLRLFVNDIDQYLN